MKTLNGTTMYVTKICTKQGGELVVGASSVAKLKKAFDQTAGIGVHFSITNVHQVFIQPLGKAGEFKEL